MIIGFANPKGGVGKSTLAINTAIELFDLGNRVAFIDAESGGPNAEIIKRIEPKVGSFVETRLEQIDSRVQKERVTNDYIVIDTPGKLGDEITALCLIADLIIISMKTSEKDLRQAKPFIQTIKAFQAKTKGSPQAMLVFTFTRKNDVTARSFRKQMQPLGMPIAKTEIRCLDCLRDNHCVMRGIDEDDRGAAQDIRNLLSEIKTRSTTLKEIGNG
ncbi:MAG: ParA family protein [Planctomycetales bacterium]|nr:ParA family protein [Planctomycetales bacterium]